MASAVDYVQASNRQTIPAPSDTATPEYRDFLDAAATIPADRLDGYQLYEDYYDGKHETRLTDRAREYLEQNGLTWSENFCEPVIDVLAERLRVTGFSTQNDDLDAWCAETWQRNRMDAVQSTIHATALIKGEAYALLDWDDELQRPIVAFNRPEIINCHYAEGNETIEWAAKVWDTDAVGPANPNGKAISRLNIYRADRIEKWFRLQQGGKGGWAPWVDMEGETISWWTDSGEEGGEPLGVPVVSFRNRPLGRAAGRSELRNVVPQNDLLNKLVLDLAMILDNQAWRQRWVVGVDPSNASFKNAPGEVWMASSEKTTVAFGDFESDDAAGTLAAIESSLSRIARRSRTPLHLLTGGDMPSGEALRAAEMGLVSKALDRQVTFGNSWEDIQLLALKVTDARGTLPVKVDWDKLIIQTQWDDPLSRNEKEEAETAVIHQSLGVSKRTLLLKLGYDADAEEEQREEEGGDAMEAMNRALDRGTAMPQAPEDMGPQASERMPMETR